MRFTTIHGDSVEVPDEWFSEAGATSFRSSGRAYLAGPAPDGLTSSCVPLGDVRPPRRAPGIVGLHRTRAVSILRAFAEGTMLPPVLAYNIPDGPFGFRVGDGFHRFHLSLAVGFTHLPMALSAHWEPFMTGDEVT